MGNSMLIYTFTVVSGLITGFLSADTFIERARQQSQLSKKLIQINTTAIGDSSSTQAKRTDQKFKVIKKSNTPWNDRDYSHAYWLNGWRKHADDNSPDLLCFETGYYGFTIDVARIKPTQYATFNDNATYSLNQKHGSKRLESLKNAELNLELTTGGRKYYAVSSKVLNAQGPKKLESVRLWESGKIAQHFDIQELTFEDQEGNKLSNKSKLSITAWPKSLTFVAELSPAPEYKDGPMPGMNGAAHCVVEKPLVVPGAKIKEGNSFTCEGWVKVPEKWRGQTAWFIFKNYNVHTDGFFGMQYANGSIAASINIGGGPANHHHLRSRHNVWAHNQWNHVALSYDGTSMQVFLNGKLQVSKKIGKKRAAGKFPMQIGGFNNPHVKPAKALFDQLRVWNRALTPNELISLHKNQMQSTASNGMVYSNNFDTDKAPEKASGWSDTTLKMTFKTEGKTWQTTKHVPGTWTIDNDQTVVLNCNVTDKAAEQAVDIKVESAKGQQFSTNFNKKQNCYLTKVEKRWSDKNHDQAKRLYDDFTITVKNTGGKTTIPLLFDYLRPDAITGITPILCDLDGTPTGIPVQLSKNWHLHDPGAYLRSYMVLPAKKETSKYLLRVVYGFYGGVPAASHSQLSLIGWGGNGRWEQLAIGTWGETYCMDLDMSCVDNTITDVRALMTRQGKDGKKWGWTDAGWGGDWLDAQNGSGQKLLFSEMKTAYNAHGPCLSDVDYSGYYGSKHQINVDVNVKTLRTDDYARTLNKIRYRFNQTMKAQKTSFFTVGKSHHLYTPTVVYGNGTGLIKELKIPQGTNHILKANDMFAENIPLTGPGPWWVSFPDAKLKGQDDKGHAYRSLIIRSYEANIGGKAYTNPTISFPVSKVHADGGVEVKLQLVPGKDVSSFAKGDTITFDAEFVTLPYKADDYYGPNETFRNHLRSKSSSWETTYREAQGNNLKITVKGGVLESAYPVIVKAESDTVTVSITGGIGYVPLRFENLKSAKGYALYQIKNGKKIRFDQSAKGNDFWQTDYDTDTQTFKRTYNLPLDNIKQSTWVLVTE